MRLDVTDDESMQAVVGRIVEEHEAVGILVNNAGFELAGPVEEVPLAEVRRQFDTNLFGLARLTQLVIPGMRVTGGGRIINLSSVFGRFAVPGNAYYAASKHAVAGFTDSLRRELAGFDIKVVLIEPTAVRTSLNANTTWPGNGTRGPYGEFRRQLADWHARTYAGLPHNVAGRLAVTPGQVAAAITKAAARRRPRGQLPGRHPRPRPVRTPPLAAHRSVRRLCPHPIPRPAPAQPPVAGPPAAQAGSPIFDVIRRQPLPHTLTVTERCPFLAIPPLGQGASLPGACPTA